jgi:hypothetical protein
VARTDESIGEVVNGAGVEVGGVVSENLRWEVPAKVGGRGCGGAKYAKALMTHQQRCEYTSINKD